MADIHHIAMTAKFICIEVQVKEESLHKSSISSTF